MDLTASEWQRRFEEAKRESSGFAQIIDAIRSGQIDTIRANAGWLRLLDAKLVEENERLVVELSRSNQKFCQVFEQSNDGIVILDTEGKILDINLKAQKMWGYPRTEFLGKKISDLLALGTKGEAKNLLSEFAESPKKGANITGSIFETEFEREDKSLFYAEVSVSGMYLDSEPSILCIVRDITQRKAMEREILRSNKELNDFGHVASHDLQAPLRHIRSFTKILMRDLENHSGKDLKSGLQRIDKAGSSMQALLDSLLKFAHLGGATLKPVSVNLSEIISDIVAELQHSIQAVEGIVNIRELPTVEADEMQMKQIFQNILENAFKYRRGGVAPVVTVSARCPEKMRRQSDQGRCQIIVEDNGIGFDEKYAARLFKPFERLVAKSEYEGSGIGLATVKKLVDRHNGTIEARGKEGGGATFIVTLPLKQTP